MRKQRNARTALLLAGMLFASPVFTTAAQAAEEENPSDFVISSVEDWETFAELTRTDTWSQGRTVRLAADLKFSGEDTPRIAYFAGTFDGDGHELNGVSLQSENSEAGLFDLVGPTGVIRNLNVIGAMTPRGRQVHVGGIAGVNRGEISGCTFFGNVTAHSETGGIVGRNEDSGVIRGCTSRGVVEGDTSVGGIAGYNSGILQECTNEAMINTVYTDVPFSTDDLTLALDTILQTGRITTPDNADQKTDIGGIAGLSIGTVTSCSNTASVGYEHVGYNIGGIAGRSTGLVQGCTNSGEILGRRDVGGIVGQQQPDMEIMFSESSLGKIDTELDRLQGMIDTALSDTEGYSNEASDMLLELSRLAGIARTDVQMITDDAANRADYEAARMNRTTDDIRESADDLDDASKDVSDAGSKAIDYAASVANADIGNARTTVKPLLDDILSRYTDMYVLAGNVMADNAITAPDEDLLYQAMGEVRNILQPVIDAASGNAQGDANAILNDAFGPRQAAFLESLSSTQLAELETRLDSIQASLAPYTGVTEGNTSVLDRALEQHHINYPDQNDEDAKNAEFQECIDTIKSDKYAVSSDISSLRELETSALSAAAGSNRGKLNEAGDDLNKAYRHVDDALNRIAGIDLTMSGVSPTARAASGELYLTLDEMLSRADALNLSVRGATSGTVGNLKEINTQMGYLSDLMQEAVQEQLNRSTDPADYTDDVSAESFADATRGRTSACTNNGRVTADSDVGGIIGYMGVDMQLDPERDIQTMTNRTTDARMLEKDIVDSCTNAGIVSCKGNYAGGITGRMLIGIAVENISLGGVSADGEYAGGVAGFSGAVLKGNLVKTEVRANAYAGGVAGSGSVMTDNRAMVQIRDAVQYAGAIAGKADNVSPGKISGNLYCGGDVHAIAGVDYAALAEETDHETIMQETMGVYQDLRLIFYADDEVIRTVEVGYGQSASPEEIPEVPVREGFVGVWSDTGYDGITQEKRIEAQYTRVVTLIRAEETRENGQPILLAEGSFAPGDQLAVNVLDRQEGQEILRIDLPKGQNGMHTFRVLPDPAMDDVQIRLITEDGPTDLLKTGTMGKYLTFEAQGEQVTICIEKVEPLLKRLLKNRAFPAVIAGVVVLAVLACVIGILRGKKKKAKK
ncbi:MAG: hypothetical protein K6B72_10645 [Lachnospiraceae bacterium]|nr:hypothetical protein [Lachnospiraceae bacterium]